MKQNAINIIFAVTGDQYDVYEKLSRHIEGSYAGILSNDSSNVVELVKDQYNVIFTYNCVLVFLMILLFTLKSWSLSYDLAENDISNIVTANMCHVLICFVFQKITSSVEMKDTASSNLKVTYYSDCNDRPGHFVPTNKCDGLKVDSQITFQVTLNCCFIIFIQSRNHKYVLDNSRFILRKMTNGTLLYP